MAYGYVPHHFDYITGYNVGHWIFIKWGIMGIAVRGEGIQLVVFGAGHTHKIAFFSSLLRLGTLYNGVKMGLKSHHITKGQK